MKAIREHEFHEIQPRLADGFWGKFESYSVMFCHFLLLEADTLGR
jgi:hypothetical protein